MEVPMCTNRVASTLILLGAIAALPAHSQPWRPGPCAAAQTKNWASFEKAVRSAVPGSTLYAPAPYPQTRADVLRDFQYAYSNMRQGLAEADLPADERAFYQRFMAGKLTATIETVQNWTPTRCLPESRHNFYFLLLLSDADTGVEIGRFALRESGLFSQFSPEPTAGPAASQHRFARPLATRSALINTIQARYGLAAQNAQYVDLYGSTHCRPLVPCLAFESGGSNFVLSVDDLFTVTGSSRRSLAMDRLTLGAMQRSLSPDEAVISFGAEAWVVGHRVAPLN